LILNAPVPDGLVSAMHRTEGWTCYTLLHRAQPGHKNNCVCSGTKNIQFIRKVSSITHVKWCPRHFSLRAKDRRWIEISQS